MRQNHSGIGARIFRSIFMNRGTAARESRRFFLNNLALHFRPSTVAEPALRFTLSWGLGGMAAVLVFMQLVTGMLLKFVYAPSAERAYESVLLIQNEILFGGLIRNAHHWSANLLVAVVSLHFLRVFFTGAFQWPRQFNWVVGLGLFFLVLGANFTGYLLPWDQLAYWAVTVCAGILDYLPGVGPWMKDLLKASPEIGPESLRIFYSFHTAAIPALIVMLMALHFWRVRKAGGLAVPKNDAGEPSARAKRVPTVPNLLVREASVACMLLAFVMLLSVFFDAPLGDPANQGLSPNQAKAPWYFAGLQELLLHFHPMFSVVVIPSLIVLALVLLPYLDYRENTTGVWFASPSGARAAAYAAGFSVAGTTLLVLVDEYAGGFSTAGTAAIDGLAAFAICLAAVSGFVVFLKKKLSLSGVEVAQALFAIFCAALVVLTAVNVWFRGPGMKLVLPL